MSTYVALLNWTDQGIKNFKETTHRAQDLSNAVEKSGGHVHELMWTVGECDLVCVVDFPDDEAATASLLQIGALGNVRNRTMRAFNAKQMQEIVERAG